jgi:hypothetical protein
MRLTRLKTRVCLWLGRRHEQVGRRPEAGRFGECSHNSNTFCSHHRPALILSAMARRDAAAKAVVSRRILYLRDACLGHYKNKRLPRCVRSPPFSSGCSAADCRGWCRASPQSQTDGDTCMARYPPPRKSIESIARLAGVFRGPPMYLCCHGASPAYRASPLLPRSTDICSWYASLLLCASSIVA